MSVRDSIIIELEKGVRGKAGVIDRVMECEKVTVQAVYKELRALIRDEVVLDKQKKLSLTLPFIEREYKRWKQAKEHYTHQVSFDDFLQLQKGKSLSFTFNNIIDLDLFWTQAFIILERILSEDIPRYSIVPHDWFAYARPSTDDVWTNNKIHSQRLIITHPAEVDWRIARLRKTQGYEFTGGENPLNLSEAEYVTLVGDWVFEVEFDKFVAKELNEYIWSLKNVSEVNSAKMDELMKIKGTFKLKLSNNPKKAKDMSDKVKKYFE
jgi:hypothetical protein